MSTDKILQTANLFAGRRAKKVGIIRAKSLSSIIVDDFARSMFKLSTLEGEQPVSRSNLMCVGPIGDPWQQSEKTLFKKYAITAIDPDGWMTCSPVDENEVEFFKITETIDGEKYIQGKWGSTVDGIDCLQSFLIGDYVCRQPYDHSDQWVVRRTLFDATYEVKN